MAVNRGYSYRHVLDRTSLGNTTLGYLVKTFAHSTEAEWQARLEAGEVQLDNQQAHGQERLKPGSVLIWNRPGWIEESTPQSFDMIFQDTHILVVNKPGGLPTLPGAGFYENTLLSLVQREFPEARPLHRLGRATSGLVLFARDASTASALSQSWPRVQKQYLALGSGVALSSTYDIRASIGLEDHPRLGKVHAASFNGKIARSIARPLERRVDTTVFEVDLLTGRPHQIRIHLAFIGHPLEGDPLYAAGGLPRPDQPGLPGDAGYWLHARKLVFEHPVTGVRLDLTSPAPEILRTPP